MEGTVYVLYALSLVLSCRYGNLDAAVVSYGPCQVREGRPGGGGLMGAAGACCWCPGGAATPSQPLQCSSGRHQDVIWTSSGRHQDVIRTSSGVGDATYLRAVAKRAVAAAASRLHISNNARS
jgi:hypothetical protein